MSTISHPSQAPRGHRIAGFTLIEMLIVIAVISIVASIAIPSFLGRKMTASETAVIATMRAIATAQFQFQTVGHCDTNKDVGFEFGTLRELGALDKVRGTTAPLTRHLLSSTVTKTDDQGIVFKHGYYFRLYLPDSAGKGVIGVASNNSRFDARQSQSFWTCVAWPKKQRRTGNRTFFVNQTGQIMKTVRPEYSGPHIAPPAGAALSGIDAHHINTHSLSSGTAADGRLWVLVN